MKSGESTVRIKEQINNENNSKDWAGGAAVPYQTTKSTFLAQLSGLHPPVAAQGREGIVRQQMDLPY